MAERGTIVITRDELYELVWVTPIIHLAERFGISDVGLRKICRKLDVPTPPVGWWAKKAAGKAVKVTPLPKWRPGVPMQATIAPTPDQEGGLGDAVRVKADELGTIVVPKRLGRPHPLISGWIADHRERQQEARRHRDRWPGSRFAVPDFTAGERRRHRVLHALFRSLEKHGAIISENDRRQLVATIDGEAIAFTCREKLRQVKRHLMTTHGMTPPQYREKWGLAADYPMVAPDYAEQRRTLAKSIGLGTKRLRSSRTSTR